MIYVYNTSEKKTKFSLDLQGRVEVIKVFHQFEGIMFIGMQFSKSKLSHSFRIIGNDIDLVSVYSHTAPVTDIACLKIDGRDMFVTSSLDRKAIVWFI